MDFSAIMTYLGTLIGLIGLIVACIQNKEKKRLEKVIRTNNWFNFRKTDNVTGLIQRALNLYKNKHQSNLDLEVLEELARVDAFSQDVFKEIIRQITISEPIK